MMAGDAQADALWVLSDLHLAPPGEQCVFRAHEKLVALLDHVAGCAPAQMLVLNGDVFDFLQIVDYQALSLPLAPQRMAGLLAALDGEPPERNIVQALRRLTGAGHTLCCLPGNHDPELNLAAVQAVLQQSLGSSGVLPPHGGFWRVQVAGRAVVGLHGHHRDAFNAISANTLLAAQAKGDAEVALPPGSRLVCQVINPYRRAKNPQGVPRFPFVDLLPSDKAVVLALLLLDPRLAGQRLAGALGIGASALVRAVMQRTGMASAMLGGAAAAGAAQHGQPRLRQPDIRPDITPEAAFLAGLAGTMADAMTPAEQAAPQRVASELQAYLASGTGAGIIVANQVQFLSGSGIAHGLLLRALGRALDQAREAFRPSQPDALARDVRATWGQAVIAITGHTHAAKAIGDPAGPVYINTGTWLDLVALPADTGQAAVALWLDDLAAGRVKRWQGCPVAKVDAGGARLQHWDGQALKSWDEGLLGLA